MRVYRLLQVLTYLHVLPSHVYVLSVPPHAHVLSENAHVQSTFSKCKFLCTSVESEHERVHTINPSFRRLKL